MATQMASLEANKALVRRAVAVNHGAQDDPNEIFASDFVGYMPGLPPMDRAGMEHFIAGFDAAFPGYTFEIHDQVAQGDTVYNRITWRGVHTGEFAGTPATGRAFELKGINLFKLKDGLVVEQRAELDLLGLLQQIGAVPQG